MTIRNRLIAAAFFSSALVAATAAISTAFLFDAASHLDKIRKVHLPLMDSTKTAIDNASRLAMSLDDFAEASEVGNKQVVEMSHAEADDHLHKLDQAINAVERDLNRAPQSLDSGPLTQLSVLREQLATLKTEWQRADKTDAIQAKRSGLDDLDDRATLIVVSVAGLQDRVSNGVSNAIVQADAKIQSVCHLSIVIACAMTLITVTTGTVFARNLARRLIRVNEQAKRVGKGLLDATIPVEGKDELDEIAVSFNTMVSELRESRAQLERDALYDPLTGLPNRASFLNQLADRVNTANRTGDQNYALCFIDVDHFKDVNDTLGHAAGDELLRGVAGRLQGFSTKLGLDKGFVARLGGDEFTVLISSFTHADTDSIAEKLKNITSEPLILDGRIVPISLSIGVAIGSDAVTDPKLMLSRADAALYHTKRHGRNGFTLYSDALVAPVGNRNRRTNRESVNEEAA